MSFWRSVYNQDDNFFSDRILKRFAVLKYAPNGMWTYLVSVYFMQYKDKDNMLEEKEFYMFLDKITAFIWAYAFMRPGVNALRSPTYPEMIKIVNGQEVNFEDYKFDVDSVRNVIENYVFSNGRPITKSMLAWWAYNDDEQPVILSNVVLEIEHIFSRKRQENECTLSDKNSLESLGNKVLLEKNINIRASDYRFADKKKYYQGFTDDKGKHKEATKVKELVSMAANKKDFLEADIIERKKQIIDDFIEYLKKNNLISE